VIDGELSPDGRRLVVGADRSGRSELWEKSFVDGTERLLVADGLARSFPRWSRDSRDLAYMRSRRRRGDDNGIEHSIVLLPAGGVEEQVLTAPHESLEIPSDWSADGAWVLASTSRGGGGRHRICWFPRSASPHAEIGMRVLLSSTDHDLWHGRLSPDGRWISFHAVDVKKQTSRIYVAPVEGGPWIPIAHGDAWDGKARWAADGRALYFISNRTGVFEVWNIRFDPDAGKTMGEPFKIAHVEGHGPGLSLAGSPPPGLSLAAGLLVLPLKEVSGNLWMLERIEPKINP
jgi:Tol biopolymer transport system component